MNEVVFADLEKLFLALSDQTRLRLLSLMSGGEVSVGYLADALGESQPKISRHLAYLRGTGLVSTRRDGKWVYYGIDDGLDRDVRRVLDTTLSSIRYSNPIANAEASGYSDSAQTREVEVDDWSPNEMAIHLL
ncbi:MAG TPA: metalloregulator ArsR/SmtB family transcription factor [Pyrinomonadaceae bacterium]|jgi:DNA-binding transcriptional ArsR family regulator|nr:metalloregulator ArsR/SmtB family transcription factor [Chloracidobacterium sp.]MBL0242161.1 metalloregulator ArsR/SmtB family transcription factor [Chloracidobacterium sp.]MBP9936983.1 metalloregulator ArsR/SmtB family transcription factor [Pyrinomonadaceae bacterium]HQY68697.1 metalloregulator ArsR/SmtB family transcription factor [Pyrinomonadaceae bacterium]HRA41930.1 metalloregulator ArsR/SmtB family transcription factor [Pyrinomonadaceae bacterium]